MAEDTELAPLATSPTSRKNEDNDPDIEDISATPPRAARPGIWQSNVDFTGTFLLPEDGIPSFRGEPGYRAWLSKYWQLSTSSLLSELATRDRSITGVTRSIFGALTDGMHSISTSKRMLLTRRTRSNVNKKPSPSGNKRYRPYPTVRDPKVKWRLLQIARSFQFLDRGFAEYFHVVLPSSGEEYIQSLLRECRVTLSKTQNQDHDSVDIELGDLGNFCEESIRTWSSPHMQAPEFLTTYQRDEEMMQYLQDALEVPYWEFMVDLFLEWRSRVKSLSGDVVLRVLHGARHDVNHEWRLLLTEMESSGLNRMDLEFILEGIQNKMKVLDSICCYSTASDLSSERTLDSFFEEFRRATAPIIENPPSQIQPERKVSKAETVALISLVLVFLMAAIAPGYKAFALSMQDGTTGSINDADFWYLVQNSVMAVLGNIIMVIPLLRNSWFSPAYSLMWVFFILGLAFACIAVAIYPLLNPGWSSMVSFFGSISSVASVLVMTQAVAKEARHHKIKAD